jgi:hypothetical protein
MSGSNTEEGGAYCYAATLHGLAFISDLSSNSDSQFYRVFRRAIARTAQMDEDSAAAWERDLKLDVIEHITGRLKLAMDRYFSN